MTLLNEISAMIAAVLMLLVARGFVPYLHWRNWDAADYMRLCIVLLSALSLFRMVWWDLVRPLIGMVPAFGEHNGTAVGQAINAGFNTLTAIAALSALAALHHSIPLHKRAGYTWLTAPFYPRRTGLLRRTME